MSIRPWMKFYPTDWRSDPRLRMCSIGARGLWMEMICLMHEAEPYGHLLVNGKAVTVKQLASLASVPLNEASKYLAELEDAGVYSVESDVIISRRMVRDKAKSDQDIAHGKGGGNPKLREGVNPPDNGEDKAQKLEARNQKLEKKESFRPKRVRTLYPEDFENEFWKVYPRTPIMSKVQALREFEKLSEEDRKAAIAAVPRFVAWLKTQKDHPAVHACRFLSQRRFDGFAADTTPVNTEPSWKKPPPEYLESQEQANGSKVATDVRGGPGVDQNGCDRPEKLRVPGGAALRPEVGGEGGDAPHDPKRDA